jgi:solute carrier family 1 (high affinity glutamate transporter) protein 2
MCSKTDFKKYLKNNLLLILTIISVIIGTGLGSILRIYVDLNKVEKEYFAFPGEIFLRILKFILLPLIGSSIASSIWGIQKKKIGNVIFCK